MPDEQRFRRFPQPTPPADAVQHPSSPAPADGADPEPQRKRLDRSIYRWKDYQNWAERMREGWKSDL